MSGSFVAGNAEDVDMVNWNWLFSFVDANNESYFLDLNEVADVIDLSQWSDAMLASCIISHDDIHYKNIAKVDRIAREMGVRDKLMFVAGGTQVTDEGAREAGADVGFGRGSHGCHVATFLVKERARREQQHAR